MSIFGRLTSAVVLLNLLVFALVGFSIYQSRSQYQERAEITTQNLTHTLESEISGAIKTDDVALLAVIDEYKKQRVHGNIDGKALNAYIEQVRSRLPEIDALRITDAHGMLIYGSDVIPSTKTSLADRPHFIRLRDDSKAELIISQPQISRVNQKWVIVFARRINQADGSFGGMAFAAITLNHLTKTFSNLSIGAHGIIALRDGELRVVVRYPEFPGVGSAIGSKAMAPDFRKMMETGQSAVGFVFRSHLDEIERTYTYRKVGAYPLYIGVGLASEDYLSQWRNEAAKQAALAALFTLITLLAAWLIYRIWKRNAISVEFLVHQEAKLRTLADFTNDWVYWQGPNREIYYMSPSCERVTGYSAKEFIDDPGLLLRVMHPEDRQVMEQHLHDIAQPVACQNEGQQDFRIVRRDGEIRWIAHNCRSITGPNGESMGCRVGNRDVTENRQTEQQLRIAATAFESQEGMVVTDTDTVILRVNRAFTDITGYTAEEVVGKKTNLLKSGRHDQAFYAEMWQSLRSQGVWQGEIWNRRKNGEVYPEWLTITAVKGNSGEITHYVSTLTDITLRKAAADEIKNLAFYDPLTQLPNRRLLMDRLKHALASSTRSGREGALLFIDLDNFKTLNDTLGHNIGDLLLQKVAERLTSCVREGDTAARLGGDEFVVMLEDLSEQDIEAAAQAETIGHKILDVLNQPYQLGPHECHSTPSIGATLFNDHKSGIEELLKQADIAMYQAKTAGRNALRFFDPQMQDTINARAALEGELRKALANQQFHLYYQIQVDGSFRPLGAEALIRWLHPERGLVFPAQFIPLAEETGLILPIGLWVLETACAQLKAWQQNAHTRALGLSVNVSAKQFRQVDFVAQVQAVVQRQAINPKLLKLELTESMLLENIEETVAKMNALKEIGVRISLDDFGTGYSSLQYLKRLPLDQLKIDQSFVHDLALDSSDKIIVRTIIAMAQSLNLDVIAEGVETEAQRLLLQNKGCTHYQGYLFDRPVPIEQFEAFLNQG